MLPPFEDSGNLPKGLHWVTWAELVERFGSTPHRRRLLAGLLRALRNLRAAGCRIAYVDGSFVTAAEHPRDFDACWDTSGVDLTKIDPVLKEFGHGRATQKMKYLGELFPARMPADHVGNAFLDFFQVDKSTGDSKGIVALLLEELPQ